MRTDPAHEGLGEALDGVLTDVVRLQGALEGLGDAIGVGARLTADDMARMAERAAGIRATLQRLILVDLEQRRRDR